MTVQDAFSLKGKHILVVGASSGIGRATAVRCAEAGASVSVCARRAELLRDLVAELPGNDHGYGVVDVRNTPGLGKAFDSFVGARGPFDGMVYSAGINRVRPISVIGEDYWSDMEGVNLRGALFSCKEAVSGSRASREGMSVCLVSSIATVRPAGAGMAAYVATKSGVEGIVLALASELARRKIRISAVQPGAILTAFWEDDSLTNDQVERLVAVYPLGEGHVNDVAYACVYLLSPAARWITGACLKIDGGVTTC